jgi:pyruvate, orthophosphate dikinase
MELSMHQQPQGSGFAAATVVAKRVFLFPEIWSLFANSAGEQLSDDVLDQMRAKFGGKASALAVMHGLGLPVPPGLTVETSVCQEFEEAGGVLPTGVFEEALVQLRVVEDQLGRYLGDPTRPLLVSVRSGAKNSMPGMMDTVLNLGLNDQTVAGLAAVAGERFAYDCYRRFIEMYSEIVLGLPKDAFDRIREEVVAWTFEEGNALSLSDLKEVVAAYKEFVATETGSPFPADVFVQLENAMAAVFRSWHNDRANFYRNEHGIPHTGGTAVTVQSMVFGNKGKHSATGVAFTRNPNTGEPTLYVDYLVGAQGEDVVSGTVTPRHASDLRAELPKVHATLEALRGTLEGYYRDMQDIEFTVEEGVFWALQTRAGKRSAAAAVRIAVDLVHEGLISREKALRRIEPDQLVSLLLPTFDKAARDAAVAAGQFLARGGNASPGAATGTIIFDADEAATLGQSGAKVILVRRETRPDDIRGMKYSQGVVTSRGGMTSHAAVVGRGMGKPCVVGAQDLEIDSTNETITVGTHVLKKGEIISLDGTTGEVFLGQIDTQHARLTPEYYEFMGWADEISVLKVRANADTPSDAEVARNLGAVGIGLCRTEHMFMEGRLPAMRRMIMADDDRAREAALAELLPMQRDDFIRIFRTMNGLPVTIRLLDPPLHEFLKPGYLELSIEVAVAEATGSLDTMVLSEKKRLLAKVRELHEENPMMGWRGCRLGLTHPAINIMQVTAIFEAAIAVTNEGLAVMPEIMIPLVGHVNELKAARETLEQVAREVMAAAGVEVPYMFGTMIEVPRAALIAGALADVGEFFSFGTNDLTQLTYGISRDDEGIWLKRYIDGVHGPGGVKRQIYAENPFEVLDADGVGKLMRIAVDSGLKARPSLKLGICGEHGGNPKSIALALSLGLH